MSDKDKDVKISSIAKTLNKVEDRLEKGENCSSVAEGLANVAKASELLSSVWTLPPSQLLRFHHDTRVAEIDGDSTPGLAAFILLSFVTCGFYALYWYYKIGNRLQANAPRYGLMFQENGTTVLMWQIVGALRERVEQVRVYARVDPAQKIRIVEALQARGHFVAMTGDGVNDAPALKRADIGVAMGQGGTDVAREASSLVLLDDNFATIVAAVKEGRRIHDNIRKFVRYTMTDNSGEIWTIFLAPLLFLPIPLLPIHILWINLVTDGLPGLALAAEPAEPGIMQRPPRAPTESMFAGGMWQHILGIGLLIGGLCLGVQAWAISAGNPHWQTMVFTVLILGQMAHVLAIRSESEPLWRLGLRSNKPLLFAVLLTFALQLAIIYVPWLHPIFKTTPLGLGDLAVCLGAALVVYVVVELEKAWRRQRRRPPCPNGTS